jgi:DNA-directed RNA polymerase omega subunit
VFYQTLDDLLKHAENRFLLVNLASKRAGQILQEDAGSELGSNNALTIALEEIAQGTIKYERTKEGIK